MKNVGVRLVYLGMVAVLLSTGVVLGGLKTPHISYHSGYNYRVARVERSGGAVTTLVAITEAVKSQCHTVSLQYAATQTEPNAASLHSCLQTQRGTNTTIISMCGLLFVAANDACKGVHGGLFDSDNDECQASFIESTNAFPVWAGEEGYCGWY